MTLRIHPLTVEGLHLARANVADPFRVEAGRVLPRVAGADYVVVHEVEAADVAALPAHWLAYRGELRDRALARIDEAARHGRPTIVWSIGDGEAALDHGDVILFELGARAGRPRHLRAHHTYPVFISDLLESTVAERRDGPIRVSHPLVGFCGQATERWRARARRVGARLRERLVPPSRRTHVPQPWSSPMALRRRALALLEADPAVETDFVVRNRHRAGVRDLGARRDPAERTTVEFHDNLLRTDYTLCVRGAGNFSTRLYETLCAGRVPVIVDADGVLPWREHLDWEQLAVLVPSADLGRLPGELVARHRSWSGGLEQAQLAARTTWEGWLSLDGFFSRFSRHFPSR